MALIFIFPSSIELFQQLGFSNNEWTLTITGEFLLIIYLSVKLEKYQKRNRQKVSTNTRKNNKAFNNTH